MEQVNLNIRAQDFGAELVKSDVALLMLFDSKPISNELNGIKYDSTRNINYDIIDGVFNGALKLQPDLTFDIPLSLDSKAITISFWLRP